MKSSMRGSVARTVAVLALVGIGSVTIFLFLREVFSGRLIVRDFIFQVGNFQLRWYSVCIAAGILLSYILARRRLGAYGIKPEDLDEGMFWGVLSGIVGARAYYVIFNWGYYSRHPSEIPKVWHGGLAIHGAVFGVLLMIFFYSKVKRYFSFVKATDLFTSVLPLGQAIGRWGNFFNYEAYGRPTDVPWRMFVPENRRMLGFENADFFHPTFLYESLWNLGVFLLLYKFVDPRKRSEGETTALYLVLYSLGRFWIEGLRLDSLMAGGLRAAQVVSLLLILIGSVWYAFLLGRRRLEDRG